MQETLRFTPELRVFDYSGMNRAAGEPDAGSFDLMLVTYGTLRRDIEVLRKIPFEYVVLDEAQVIKNPKTLTAKTSRLLNARNRLALSGTPVENHIGDLWSIFEFLNPGMLGSSALFSSIQTTGETDESSLGLLRQALKPFILRRTKAQVASDLPPRTEEVIYCEMKPAQRKVYDNLKEYYRVNLLKKVENNGINRSKILILEALLRLRQAACHPDLIKTQKKKSVSAKLETLLSRIQELVEEGSKCIVFSQFTKMLTLIRNELDRNGIGYEYLDGRTRYRRTRVERFQNDSDCLVFLISLKAGGVGLNLTAAEYVFLFDPWWNPAVEAQAIDRTHRIGQQKPVFAYRLICKNTVEEKVLELQKRKRKLVDAVISSDESLLRSITSEDLAMLLG